MSIERGSLFRRKERKREILPVGEATILNKPVTWREIKKPVIDIFEAAVLDIFPDRRISRSQRYGIENIFTSPTNIIAIQKNITQEMIGWTSVIPHARHEERYKGAKTAYLADSVLYPEYQRQGIVWKSIEVIEDTLRKQKYTHLEMHALQERPGWPRAIERYFGDRIEDKYEDNCETTGDKMIFYRAGLYTP